MIGRTSALQHTATHCNSPWMHSWNHSHPLAAATHCNTLQHTATHCNTRQHTSTHGNTLQLTLKAQLKSVSSISSSNTLQHTATHCNSPWTRSWNQFRPLAAARGLARPAQPLQSRARSFDARAADACVLHVCTRMFVYLFACVYTYSHVCILIHMFVYWFTIWYVHKCEYTYTYVKTELPRSREHCNTLQHTATHCSTLQHTGASRIGGEIAVLS